MRLKLLALIAKALGIQFKVDGLPYGATSNSGPGHSASLSSDNSTQPSHARSE